MQASVRIQSYLDLETLSKAAARIFVEEVARATAVRGRFAVALSGGSTPRRTYELLAGPPFRDVVNWPQVFIFWGDERGVPPGDPRSNYRMAWEAFLRRVPIPPENLHPMAAFPSVEMGARDYEAKIRAFFDFGVPSFDLVFLGLGEDGHTASLFPWTAVLGEERRWVAAVSLPEPQVSRVTLTPGTFNQAARVMFLVGGAAKAKILQEVLEGPQDPRRLPAQLIHPLTGELLWLVDQEAAALLSEEKYPPQPSS